MKNEQDRLHMWLANYRARGANEALLDRIVAVAAATPQRSLSAGWTWSPRAWALQISALACVALFGLWSGNVLTQVITLDDTQAVVATETALQSSLQAQTDDDAMSSIIFGEKTWKEINL